MRITAHILWFLCLRNWLTHSTQTHKVFYVGFSVYINCVRSLSNFSFYFTWKKMFLSKIIFLRRLTFFFYNLRSQLQCWFFPLSTRLCAYKVWWKNNVIICCSFKIIDTMGNWKKTFKCLILVYFIRIKGICKAKL